MRRKPRLLVDYCSYEAAKYAVMNWHYSRRMPRGKNIYLGVWEDGQFIGAVIFGTGTRLPYKTLGIKRWEICELVRVALREHQTPVTRIVRFALKKLREKCPGIRVVVSYADPNYGHVGAIYQAGNWIYDGPTPPGRAYRDLQGNIVHSRAVSPSGWKRHYGRLQRSIPVSECERLTLRPKYRYLYPLDERMRPVLEARRKPYPKRDEITRQKH